MALPLIAGGAALNLAGQLFGGRKRRKAAEQLARRAQAAVEETRVAGDQRLQSVRDAFKGAFSEISSMDDLDIDTRFADQEYSDAQRALDSQFGRSMGEEMARDSVRQSTADAVSMARQTGGSTADLLAAVSGASQGERSSMRDIDFQSIQNRENRLQNAMSRLQTAASRRSDFYNSKEISEFNSERERKMMLSDLAKQGGLSTADTAYNNAMELLNARNAAAQGRAGVDQVRAANISGVFSAIGNPLMNYGLGSLENSDLLKYIFGGEDKDKE